MLTFRRLLNLVYFAIVRNMSAEQRQDLDRLLAPPAALEVRLPSGARRRAPKWWKGDGGAVASSVQAAKELGFGVGSVDVARTG